MTVQYLNLIANFLTVASTLLTAVVALVAVFKAQKITIMLDGQLSELKTLIAKSAKAEGVIEGKAEERSNPS